MRHRPIIAPGMFSCRTANGQHAIHELRLARGLDGISNHLAAHQRILHCPRCPSNAVGDGDGAEHLRHAARFTDGLVRCIGQRLDAGVAGVQRAVPVGEVSMKGLLKSSSL